jgi:predicted RND superfamily exporter protein
MESLLQPIIISLITFIAGIIGYWLMFGRNLVTRTEVSTMIQTESPYLEDRKFIQESLKNNDEGYKKLAQAIEKFGDVLTDLKIEIAYLRQERQHEHSR